MSTTQNAAAIREARSNNLTLVVRPSGIAGVDVLRDASETVVPGNGVFTTRDIPKKAYISYYTGWIINYADFTLLKEHNAHSHAISLSKMRECIMGVETAEELASFPQDERGLCSFVNHSNSPNAISVIIDGQVLYRAIKHIPAGSEIFIHYGAGYWKKTYIRDAGAGALRQRIMNMSGNKTTFKLGERSRRRTRSDSRGGKKSRRRKRKK